MITQDNKDELKIVPFQNPQTPLTNCFIKLMVVAVEHLAIKMKQDLGQAGKETIKESFSLTSHQGNFIKLTRFT